MKKRKYINFVSILFILMIFGSSGPLFASDSTANWYIYKGSSTTQSFAIKFPTNWQAKTFGEELQGFGPANQPEEVYFLLREFEGKSFQTAINYYLDEKTEFVESEDFVFQSTNGDLLAKKVVYKDIDSGKDIAKTFIKRGTLIVSLTNPGYPVPSGFEAIVSGIHDSFYFTSNWHQYIDFKNKYTFIFPSNWKIANLGSAIEVKDTLSQLNKAFFRIEKYENTGLDEAIELAKGQNDKFDSKNSFNFHGFEDAVSVIYFNETDKKKYGKVFVKVGNDCFSLTNVNIETNYPMLNYYNQFIVEMLESFEIFDIEGEYHSYRYFTDVRDNHANAQAINSLADAGVISGYPDGTFKPDGEINRAELTKMIVENVKDDIDSDKYSNCFPDVKDEWFAPYVCYAMEQNWVEGYTDGKFKPANKINRAEALKIILGIQAGDELNEEELLEDKSVLDVKEGEWYSKYFVYASNRELLDLSHTLKTASGYYYYPNLNITRKEVAETIYREGNK